MNMKQMIVEISQESGTSDEHGINTEVILGGRKFHESNRVLNILRDLQKGIREPYIEFSDIPKVS